MFSLKESFKTKGGSIPIILALGRERQEDQEFQVSFGYIV